MTFVSPLILVVDDDRSVRKSLSASILPPNLTARNR
jgi:hypothetical protein